MHPLPEEYIIICNPFYKTFPILALVKHDYILYYVRYKNCLGNAVAPTLYMYAAVPKIKDYVFNK